MKAVQFPQLLILVLNKIDCHIDNLIGVAVLTHNHTFDILGCVKSKLGISVEMIIPFCRRREMANSDHVMQKVSSSSVVVAILILVLVGMPGTALSKTLKRGCKGAEMIQYEIDGKKYTHTEPFKYTGTGMSKGAVPSPTKARERACKDAAQQAASAADRDRLLNIVCAKHPNASGRILFLGGIGRSKGEQKTQRGNSMPTDFRCQTALPSSSVRKWQERGVGRV